MKCENCGAVDEEQMDRCEICGKRLCDACMNGDSVCEVNRKQSGASSEGEAEVAMRLPSASHAGRAMVCPASAVLPRADSVSAPATRGTAGHEFLATVGKLGREEALARVPEEHRAYCEGIDLAGLPVNRPEAFSHEVALAFDIKSGEAIELGRDLTREQTLKLYSHVDRSHVYVGTADVVALEGLGTRVYIWDLKTGHTEQDDWQLKVLALAASRVYGMPEAVCAYVYIREDGSAWERRFTLDEVELALIELDLQDLAARIEYADWQISKGQLPTTKMGDHCRYCPSLPYCPGQTALVRTLADGEDFEVNFERLLTPETAGVAWERLDHVEALVERMRGALKTMAETRPFLLPNGNEVSRVEAKRDRLVAEVARQVIAKHLGADIAEAASEFKVTKAGIERALRKVAEELKQPLTKLKAGILFEIAAAGGVIEERYTTIKEHRVEGPTTPAFEAPPQASGIDTAGDASVESSAGGAP